MTSTPVRLAKSTSPTSNPAAGSSIKIETYIRQLVDATPPLSAEQHDRLAVLLRGAGVPT
jgi:hypothetical protein